MATYSQSIRSGLPRVPGGEPWPASGGLAPTAVVAAQTGEASVDAPATSTLANEAQLTAPPVAFGVAFSSTPLRRGLPRQPGGEPWPAEGLAPERLRSASSARTVVVASSPVTSEEASPAIPMTTVPENPEAPAIPAPEAPAEAARDSTRVGSKTLAQWLRLGALGAVSLVVLAGVIVLAARGVTTLPGYPEFAQRFPGEYQPAVPVDVGFPAWARWTHYLNFFFLVLVVRSGLLVRYQQRPPAFYTSKTGGKKVSIYLWLHTSIDILWLLNGVVFVVLLFATSHWARIVPTSWEVFPNAASAMLQYLTLDWPQENGWVNYNSLQQLMYFAIVFIAAPLAAITGVRMSEWWPKDAAKLDKFYPAPLARAIHFPTMLFFVIFAIIHVFLVLTTGALRNLNHMFAGNDGATWFGFWMFTAGLAVVVGAWMAARPLVMAPIASVFGKVSNR